MQFIKKNYEKILLGLVLVGLVVVAVFLLFLVASEKQAQADRRNKITTRTPKPLFPPELSQVDASLKRAGTPFQLVLSDSTHKLFNPERWQKSPDGHLVRNPVGVELLKTEITKIGDLYFIVTLDTINPSEAGTRYGITIEQQAAVKPSKKTIYAAKGDKPKEYDDKKDTVAVRDVQGPPEDPTALVLEFSDSDAPVTISKDKPFRRVDGHTADMKYPPENRVFLNRRANSPLTGKILVAGEEYNIVSITENEVVLRGKNQKNWIIKNNAAP
jgi:hypothetical protein